MRGTVIRSTGSWYTVKNQEGRQLEARLKGYVNRVAERLTAPGREIVNFGLVDCPERAFQVGHEVRRQDIDIVVLYVTTYALS